MGFSFSGRFCFVLFFVILIGHFSLIKKKFRFLQLFCRFKPSFQTRVPYLCSRENDKTTVKVNAIVLTFLLLMFKFYCHLPFPFLLSWSYSFHPLLPLLHLFVPTVSYAYVLVYTSSGAFFNLPSRHIPSVIFTPFFHSLLISTFSFLSLPVYLV